MLKYGNRVQRSLVVDKIKEHYLHLMTNKYSHYLASKAYYYAPEPEQKLFFRQLVTKEINKYIIHAVKKIIIIITNSTRLRLSNTFTISLLMLNVVRWYSHSTVTISFF